MFNLFKSLSGSGPVADFMPWSDEYKLGIKMIDDDHRSLFNTANHLHRAVKTHEGHETVKATFDMLTKYVHEHFAREEQLMEEANYPGLDEHRRLHANFIRAFFSTKQSYIVAPKMFDFDGFLDFLKKWLINHVLVEDPKYAYLMDKDDD